MYQASSVGKRDFRDPRKIEGLWDFLFNESLLNCDASAAGRAERKNGLETCRRNCSSQIRVSCSASVTDSELPRSKSMMCKRVCDGRPTEDPTHRCEENPHESASRCRKFRISDFPTQIDRFVPHEKLPAKQPTTEYQDEFDRVATIVFRYNIHSHSHCRNGEKCEHPIRSSIRRRRL